MNLLGQLVLGWLAADLITGLLHWVYDRVWWPAAAQLANADHHNQPLAFASLSFWERSRLSLVAAAAVTGGLCLAFGWSVAFLTFAAGLGLWNEVHLWAHCPRRAPRWILPFQEAGLLQSPKGHALHHRPPRCRSYCLLTDWLNPFLDALGCWTLLERVVPPKKEITR